MRDLIGLRILNSLKIYYIQILILSLAFSAGDWDFLDYCQGGPYAFTFWLELVIISLQ